MKYPKGSKKVIRSTTSNEKIATYGNRGMDLEKEINETNQYYLEKDIAVIYKKPTPIKVVKMANTKTQQGIIKEAFFEMPSTTDYNGIYKLKYIDFEAKETLSETSFPLNNIHQHQIDHIRRIHHHGGICFLIVRFKKLNLTYLLFAKDFLHFIDENKRKSIPLEYFKIKGHLIKDKFLPRVDYLSIIDQEGCNYDAVEND